VHAEFPTRGGLICGAARAGAIVAVEPRALLRVDCATCRAYIERHRLEFGLRPSRVPACRECGCTDLDCSGCIAKTGTPCHWVEPDLCSACAGDREAA